MLYDNYSYLVVDTAASVAVVVDPADPEKVQVKVFFNVFFFCFCNCISKWKMDERGGQVSGLEVLQ